MASTITANMSLIVPTVGQEYGPQYATDINNDLSLLDSHDHTTGKGVQITPAAININSALSFNSNSITSLAALTFTVQTTTISTDYSLYTYGYDLYYVDGLGNNIQMTRSGSVAGSSGTIANLVSPASATFVSGDSTIVFQSAGSTAANLDAGALIMRNLSPNSTYALTLSAPANLTSNYGIQLPAIPSSQKIMTLDNAGNMAAPYTVDGSTITINSNVIGVPAGGITGTQIAANTITSSNIQTGSITAASISAAGLSLNTGTVTYTSNGTFTAPSNVSRIAIFGAGGGGGGGGGGQRSAGGSGGDGGTSSFNGTINFYGGRGGGAGGANDNGGGTGAGGSGGSNDATGGYDCYPGGNGSTAGGGGNSNGAASPYHSSNGASGGFNPGYGGASAFGGGGTSSGAGGSTAAGGAGGNGGSETGGHNGGAGGGGAGAKSYLYFVNVTPGNSYSITIGSGGSAGNGGGGAGGVSGASGGSGGSGCIQIFY